MTCRICASGGYCRQHLKAVIPEKKQLSKVSEKRKAEEKEYKKKRAAFLALHTICQAKIEGCKGKATEVHHMKGRVGDNYLNMKYFLSVCHHCHDIIERNPAFARQQGFSLSRLAKPVKVTPAKKYKSLKKFIRF